MTSPWFYDRALTPAEVQTIYAAGSAGNADDVGNAAGGVRVEAGAANNTVGGTFQVFVASNGNSTVGRFASDGSALGGLTGGVSAPYDVQRGPDGNLYVANRGNNSVTGYDGRTGRCSVRS